MHENSKISCSSPISKSDIILLTYTKAQAYPEIFLKYLIILLFSVKDQTRSSSNICVLSFNCSCAIDLKKK